MGHGASTNWDHGPESGDRATSPLMSSWTLATAKDLGLEYRLHPRGRPPKSHGDHTGPDETVPVEALATRLRNNFTHAT